MAKIEAFEVHSSGNVKLRTYKNNHSVEHEWYGVPKKVIMRLLSAKSMPDSSDVEKWINDAKEAAKDGICCCRDWWSE